MCIRIAVVSCALLLVGCATTPSARPVAAPAMAQTREVSGDVYDIARVTKRPVAVYQIAPRYPFELRKRGVQGSAVVDFIVDQHGVVRNAYAMRETDAEFGAAAVAAISQWRFKPGYIEGRPVNTHMQVPMVFSLN